MRKVLSLLICLTLMLTSIPIMADAAVPGTYYGANYADSLYRSMSYTDISKHWAKTSIYKMGALGVIRGTGGKFNPNGKISRQQAIAMLVILMGKQADAEALGANAPAMTNLTPAYFGYLNFAMSQGIISAADLGTISWKGLATRQEVAAWISKALGFQPIYGQEQQAVYAFRDYQSIDQDKIPYVEPVVVNGIMAGNSANLFRPKGTITRAEISSVLDKASQAFLPQRNFSGIEGSVIYTDGQTSFASYTQSYFGSGQSNQANYHVLGTDGGSYTLVKDIAPAAKRDFIVVRNGVLSKSDRLAVGDNIRVLLDDKNQIIYAEVAGGAPSAMYVTLEGVDLTKRTISVQPEGGNALTLNLAANYRVTFDGYPGSLNDLVAGQQLNLSLVGTQVSEIRSSISYPYPGDQEIQEGRIVYGTLTFKSASRVEVKDDSNDNQTYQISGSTSFTRSNKVVGWSDLQAGDYLKIYLNGYNSDQAYKIEVTGASNTVSGLYLAKLQSVDLNSSKISLTDVSKYHNGSWESASSFTSLKVASDAGIYNSGVRVTLDTLKGSYAGSYCYFATSTSLGEERIVKMNLKNGYDRKYTGSINNLSVNLSSLTVDQVSAELKYDDGIIVVRNNKLIKPESLVIGQQGVYFVNVENDIKRAKAIVIEGVDAPSLTIYRGVLSKVRTDYIEISSYSVLNENDFDADRDSEDTKTLELIEETDILNGMITTSITDVSKDNFVTDGLAGDYDDAYVYVIADKNTVLAINLTAPITSDDIGTRLYTGESIITGTVETDVNDSSVTLTDVKTRNMALHQWDLVSDATVDLSKALILKDNKVVGVSSLNQGNGLYVLKAGTTGLLAIVK
ncbi:MAG: S-layer homology domain-containing protein [Ignavibacteriales bacterium]